MPTGGLTSVIIVAADSGPGLAEGVGRVLASSVPVEVLVSDNASTDGSLEHLQQRYGGDARLRIVHNGRNLGFGAGVNRVAGLARGDVLLVLNPDCLVDTDTLARLRAQLEVRPGIGLVGARIQDEAGRDEPASLRRDPTLRRSLCTLTGLQRFAARWPALQGVDLPPGAARGEDQPAEAVSGAAMLLPRDAFDAVQGFDEGYFLHCEDLDLCRRLRDAGYTVWYAGSVPLLHGKGGSSRHRPVFVAWHKHRGMWRWFRRFDPAARNPLLAGLVWAGLWTRFGLLAPLLAWRGWRRRRAGRM